MHILTRLAELLDTVTSIVGIFSEVSIFWSFLRKYVTVWWTKCPSLQTTNIHAKQCLLSLDCLYLSHYSVKTDFFFSCLSHCSVKTLFAVEITHGNNLWQHNTVMMVLELHHLFIYLTSTLYLQLHKRFWKRPWRKAMLNVISGKC